MGENRGATRMRIVFLILFVMLGAELSRVNAQTPRLQTANDFVQICRDTTSDEISKNLGKGITYGLCQGFFNGLVVSSGFAAAMKDKYDLGRPLFCVPNGVTNDQARKVFLKFMEDHPEQLHENGANLAVISLMKAFPCSNSNE
jgi:hypothetical protein